MFGQSLSDSWRAVLVVGLSLGLVACGDDDPTPVDASTGVDSAVADGGGVDAGQSDAAVEDGGATTDAAPADGGETDGGTPPETNPACTAELTAALATVDLTGFSPADAPIMVRTGGNLNTDADYAGRYRDDLANHPGCTPRETFDANSEALITDNEATVPAGMRYDMINSAYGCAAKSYTQNSPDTTKPIVILVHGNSSGVLTWEEYAVAARAGTTIANVAGFLFEVESTTRPMLASRLLDDGYEVIAFDARTDLVAGLTDFSNDPNTGNGFFNIDHGWAVPMLQSLITSVLEANDGREIALVGHSLGVTVIRDALRRLWNAWQADPANNINPFARTADVILLSGANHGVSNGQLLCDSLGDIAAGSPNMRGTVTCEMGDRGTFVPTYFTEPLNGPDDVWSTPCADGDYAFGQNEACGGNVVEYTTVTMRDLPDGMLQDEFISEASSQLWSADSECVDNELLELTDFDASSFFLTILPGFFANHFGSARAEAGMALIEQKLAD